MAQTAAQRKAAEARAEQQAAAQEEVDEFAAGTATADDTGVSDAEKLAEAEGALADALDERAAAEEAARQSSAAYEETIRKLGEALGIEAADEDLVNAAVERINASDELNQKSESEKVSESAPTSIRVTLEELDGAGKPLRKYGSVVPLVQANPESVASVVKRTVEEILNLPLQAAPALQPEPVD